MAYYPQNTTGLGYITYPVGPTANVTYPTSGGANTKGTYTQLAATSAITANWLGLAIGFNDLGANTGRYLIDIATGAAASEVIKIADVMVDAAQTAANAGAAMGYYEFPWAVASGTRIAARIACSITTKILGLSISLAAAGGVAGIASFTTYGADAADSGGAAIDPGGTVDTKGAYTQLSASSSAVTQALTLGLSFGGNALPAAGVWAIDIATGAGGAEVVLFPDLRLSSASTVANAAIAMPRAYSFLTYIAASTRLAVRASSTVNDATDRLIDVTLYAGVAPAESGGGGGLFGYAG